VRRVALIVIWSLAVAAPPAAAAPTAPLGHHGRWITDAHGRVVILHGLNMVYKRPPYYPRAAGFGADDARFLHRHGFNGVRLGVIYKAVEPRPGHYRDRYLARIASTERTLGRHGVFSLLDFHQDLYNERFQGEGWPNWAVQDDGLPNPENGFPGNYLTNPALNRAFDHFWANDPGPGGVGLQDRYAAAWRHVAGRFRTAPYVVGYDLMNEPWPGSVFPTCANPAGCPAFDAAQLTEFTKRVIARIRKADRTTLAFYEPLLTFDFGANTSLGDVGGRHAGISFHVYCLPGAFGGPTGDACQSAEDIPFQNADAHSAETGDAELMTEFGATDDLATLGRITSISDQHQVGWLEWHYCGCADPTTQAALNAQALVKNPRRAPRGKNVKWAKLKVLERPYPQAVAGTPTEFAFDPDSRVFHLHYSTKAPTGRRPARRLTTRVYIPRSHYRAGYEVKAQGATVISRPNARYLLLRRLRHAAKVGVTVRPSTP
jgi:endoglycosylceramidase